MDHALSTGKGSARLAEKNGDDGDDAVALGSSDGVPRCSAVGVQMLLPTCACSASSRISNSDDASEAEGEPGPAGIDGNGVRCRRWGGGAGWLSAAGQSLLSLEAAAPVHLPSLSPARPPVRPRNL